MLTNAVTPTTAMSATWTDNGAYSIKWYNKSQTNFDISTPQELAGVAYLVNNNFTDFSGKTLNIIADIDLIGRDWTPIGLGSYTFNGFIEGNNHTISNINITSGSPSATGFWITLQNSTMKNLNFKGNISTKENHTGFIAYKANSCQFENISISCEITYKNTSTHGSTRVSYESSIAGMVANATNCSFTDIRVEDVINYKFGASDGSSCYGDINLDCGGLVAIGSNLTFTKCHAINKFISEINGYSTTTNYDTDNSFITFGGIVGQLSNNSSKIVGCLAENRFFKGSHPVGTFDTKRFIFGGIVYFMSTYDRSVLKNCVAINDSYYIYGHEYSWQAAYYHTNSSFGGVAYNVPKNYGGCYSNNDVTKSVTKCLANDTKENGSTAFSKSEMNTQSFVDELNLYSQLEFDEDYWELVSGKLSIKQDNDNGGVGAIEADQDKTCCVYNTQGVYIGDSMENLRPGMYIVRTQKSTTKILVR